MAIVYTSYDSYINYYVERYKTDDFNDLPDSAKHNLVKLYFLENPDKQDDFSEIASDSVREWIGHLFLGQYQQLGETLHKIATDWLSGIISDDMNRAYCEIFRQEIDDNNTEINQMQFWQRWTRWKNWGMKYLLTQKILAI